MVLGLPADLPRKNCWTIAEWAGDANPHGMQHLLSRAVWDADAVRDDVREYVVEHLHDEAAVLVVDERCPARSRPRPPTQLVRLATPPPGDHEPATIGDKPHPRREDQDLQLEH